MLCESHKEIHSKFILFGSMLLFLQCSANDSSEPDDPFILHAVEELRIGDMEGNDEYVFGSIHDVAIGLKGEIIVADLQVPIVRMYDKDGTFIRNIGREGRGPGEYQFIGGLRTTSDDKIVIWDPRNLRINIYDHSGEFIEHHTINNPTFSSHMLEVDQEGNFYLNAFLDINPELPNGKMGWLKVSPAGEVVDTLKIPLDEEVYEQAFVVFTSNGSAYPFLKRPQARMSPHGYLITGNNDTYSFEMTLQNGSLIQVTRDHTPVQIKPEEKAQWEAWRRHYGTNNVIPETKPAYKAILTDSQGRIWIRRYTEAEYTEIDIGPHFGPKSDWWERPVFDVFQPDGVFYTTVQLPWNAIFKDAMEEYVWAAVRGEMHEQYVARFRLEELHE